MRSAAAEPPPAPCAPARITSEVASLPDPWRRALDALVASSSREGLPWSCSGARVALAPPASGAPAHLTVAMDGWPVMERDVDSPEDLVPAGEALLARPVVRRPPAPLDPPPPDDRALPAPPPAAPRPPPLPYREPRLLVDALVFTRYSGGVSAFWMGAELRAALPIDAWSVGIWARYELAVAELVMVPYDFTMSSGSIGVAAGRRLVSFPIELTAFLEPSLAVVSMDGGLDGSPMAASGARSDFRMGARLQGAIRFGSRWRGLFAFDGELSPLTLASEKHRIIRPDLPQIPSFTLGASIGGEMAVR